MQFAGRPADKAHNLDRIADHAARAVADRIDLLAFPALCVAAPPQGRTLHRRQIDALAEPLDGPSIGTLTHIARQTGVAIGAGFIERADDGRIFDSYVVCMPDGALHCHRALHVCDHKLFDEGDRFTVFNTPWGVRAAILVGVDNCVMENARSVALLGATLLIAPYRSGDANNDVDSEHGLPRGVSMRAQENGMFVVFSAGSGEDSDAAQTAKATIVDPNGDVLASAVQAGDTMVVADIDLMRIRQSAGQRWLKARRPELYGLLAEAGSGLRDSGPVGQHAGVAGKRSIALSFAIVSRRRPG